MSTALYSVDVRRDLVVVQFEFVAASLPRHAAAESRRYIKLYRYPGLSFLDISAYFRYGK